MKRDPWRFDSSACLSLSPKACRPVARYIFVAILLLTGASAFTSAAAGGRGVPLWTNTFPGGGDAIAVDNSGNVFITGTAASTVAYSNTGDRLWTNSYGGRAIAVDRAGNVFVTGVWAGQYFTVGYSGGGIRLWINRGTAPNRSVHRAVAVDHRGNVFVTGGLDGALAFSGAGVPLWTNYYIKNLESDDYYNNGGPSAIATDNLGNVFVTGIAFATLAYAGDGVPQWTNTHIPQWTNTTYGGYGAAIAVDRTTGNVFVTGLAGIGFDQTVFSTLAYSGGGIPLWTNLYHGPGNSLDWANAIAVDRKGNVFVTGCSTFLNGHGDYTTIGYSGAGVPLWTNRYAAGVGRSMARAIAVDNSGNVFVTGDADIGDNVSLRPICATVAYSGQGLPLWTNRYDPRDPTYDYASGSGIAVDGSGNVFVTGTASISGWHSFTIKYSSSVPPNLPPIVSCTAAATYECGTPVEVAAHVSDPDGDALSVLWSVNGQLVQTNSVLATNSAGGTDVSFIAELPLGTNVVQVLVSDEAANTASCSVTVRVIDTTPPVIMAVYSQPSVLWPPNHRMVQVRVSAQVTDNCSAAEWKITGVRSNEPGTGQGNGRTGVDWVITGDNMVSLRAERTGIGAGRIYSVLVQAQDPSGNLSEAKTVEVTVPKDPGKKSGTRPGVGPEWRFDN